MKKIKKILENYYLLYSKNIELHRKKIYIASTLKFSLELYHFYELFALQ